LDKIVLKRRMVEGLAIFNLNEQVHRSPVQVEGNWRVVPGQIMRTAPPAPDPDCP
jgi:hypothetical protein